MSKFVKQASNYGAIRPRERTKFIVVHQVNATELHSQSTSEDEFLWQLEAKARDASILGHGVHFLVLPDGSLVRDRPIEIHAALNRQWNPSSVVIRVPVVGEEQETTEAQEASLCSLLDEIETQFTNTTYHLIKGWEAITL